MTDSEADLASRFRIPAGSVEIEVVANGSVILDRSEGKVTPELADQHM